MSLAKLLVRTANQSRAEAPSGRLEALFEQQVQEVLSEPRLAEGEIAVLDDPGVSPVELVDRLVEARIRRALDGISSDDDPAHLDVRIGRGDPDGGDDASTVASEMLSTVRLESSDSAQRCLLLTNDAGFAEVTRSVPEANDVEFLDAGEALDDALRATVPAEAALRVTVANVGEVLSALRETVQQAIPEDVRERLDAEPEDPHIGETLSGKYKLEKTLGKGGFGTVYAGTDVILGAQVAIKLLNPKAASAQNALDDFLAEAKLLTTIDHENIVRWITFDRTDEGLHYFVMEFLRGQELQKILDDEGSLPATRAQEMLLQILSALQRAHRLPDGGSLLHLDLKPPNVFVLDRDHPDQPERVKVIDFGIGQHVGAQALRESAAASGTASVAGGDVTLLGGGDPEQSVATARSDSQVAEDAAGPVKRARGGTLLYASPEQCKHLAGMPDIVALDGRADLYSFGIMAFRMLTGRYPFERGDTFQAVIDSHLKEPPMKVRAANPRVPRKLGAFVDQCLEKDRERRWKDTDEAYAALQRIVHPPRWRSVAAVLLPVLIVGVLVAWWLWPPATAEPTPLFRMAAGERVSVENETLYVGADRESADLFVVDGAGEAIGADAILTVINRNTDDPETRLRAEGLVDGAVTLRALGDDFFETQVYLDYDADSGVGRTHGFAVVNIPENAWSVSAVRVHGREVGGTDEQVLRVDPRNLALSVELTVPDGFRRDHVRSVKLGDAELKAPAVTSSGEGNLEYELQLDDPGVAQLFDDVCELVVADEAGNEARRPVRLEILPPLAVPSKSLQGGTQTAGSMLLVPESEPRIELTVSHDAHTVEWKLVPEPDPWNGSPPSGTYEAGEQPVLPITDAQEHYSGVVSVTVIEKAGSVVSSRADAESVTFELPVEFSPDRPGFEVSVTTAAGERKLIADAGAVSLGSSSVEFLLRRSVDQKLRVRATARVLREDAQVTAAPAVDFEIGVARRALTIDLGSDGDGLYELEVSGMRLDADGDLVGDDAEFLQRYPFRVDTRAPAVTEFRAVEGVLRDGNIVPGISIDDASFPASVSWTVTPGDLRGSQTTADGNLDFSLETLADGAYELAVQVVDAAGNVGPRETRRFEVAAEDPTIEWLEPTGGQLEWSAKEEGWEIRARLEDGNEIDSVTYVVTSGEGRVLRDGKLSRDPAGLWRAVLRDFAPRDSEAAVEVKLAAKDVHFDATLAPESDGRTESVLSLKLPAIPLPAAITCTTDDAEMILVPGNEATYFFGGRPGERNKKEWQVEYGPAEIESYYLDAQEVTNAQFIRFLEATGGESARIAELRRRTGNHPVVDVTWEDAAAYARWAGKRLPSFVQWEYAVRGRDHQNPEGRSSDEVNYESERDVTRLWARGQGSDNIGGIWNLCGNVSEWTSNPWRRGYGEYARGAKTTILAPWLEPGYDNQSRYWLVGACQTSSSCSVFVAAPAARDSLRPNQVVGFRCAIDAKTVRDTVSGRSWNPTESK